MEKQFTTAMAILGLTIAIGMSSAAFILGVQAKKAASSQQSITVKGLAEKSILADTAEWTVSVSVTAPNFAQALAKLRSERPALDKFLIDHCGTPRTGRLSRHRVVALGISHVIAEREPERSAPAR